MTSRRLRLLAAPPLLLLLVGGAFLSLSPGKAEASRDNDRSETMEQYLTSVTKDVDAYWTQEFKDSGLPEPRVSYDWIPAGQTSSSACGELGDDAAAPTRIKTVWGKGYLLVPDAWGELRQQA